METDIDQIIGECLSFHDLYRRLNLPLNSKGYPSSGTKYRALVKRARQLNFDTSHFRRVAWNKGTRQSPEMIEKRVSKLRGRKWCPSPAGRLAQSAKISAAQKRAHAEGRGSNIGKCRWMKQPSYPEKFFMEVIKNHFQDQTYTREHWVQRFSIDFAWVAKKLAIEIDGQQHQRYPEVQARDRRKDELLNSLGWKVLRIPWLSLYHDPALWIGKAVDFVDNLRPSSSGGRAAV